MDVSEFFMAIFWGFIVVTLIVYFWPNKKFNCMQCGRLMKIQKIVRVDRCPKCGTYHARDGKGIRMIGDGDILDGCYLSLLFQDGKETLKRDPRQWSWPNQCCVCGRQTERYDDLTFVLADGCHLNKWTFKVPYCHEHTNGVQWHDDMSANMYDTPSRMALRFKSYDYWKIFKALNCVYNPNGRDLLIIV